MKKLSVFTLYGEKGASSQYRILMYKRELGEKFRVNYYSFWSDKYITQYTYNKKKYLLLIVFEYIIKVIQRLWQLYILAPKSDVVFIQKGVIPGLKNPFINHLKKRGIRIIYDVDDAIYLDKKNNTDLIAQMANIVICGNSTLYDHYIKINSDCIVIPTVENTRKYQPFWKDTYKDKIIGWIGSGVTLHNLDLIVDAVNEVVSRHPEVKFHIICNTPGDYLDRIHNSIFVKWTSEDYISEMGKFSIGIMPLKAIDINKGKCGFKLIQCLNMRKPVIATDIGVNMEIINGCGMLANNTKEWACAMEKLLFNEEEYRKCVSRVDSYFFEKYDYDLIAKRIIEVIDRG